MDTNKHELFLGEDVYEADGCALDGIVRMEACRTMKRAVCTEMSKSTLVDSEGGSGHLAS